MSPEKHEKQNLHQRLWFYFAIYEYQNKRYHGKRLYSQRFEPFVLRKFIDSALLEAICSPIFTVPPSFTTLQLMFVAKKISL